MRKRWLVVTLLVAFAAIAAAGGAALAQEEPEEGSPPHRGFAERGADILGLETVHLQAAFDEAKKDMKAEALDRRLARLVEAGLITEAQADEYRQWINSRPDFLPLERSKKRFGGHAFGRKGHKGLDFRSRLSGEHLPVSKTLERFGISPGRMFGEHLTVPDPAEEFDFTTS